MANNDRDKIIEETKAYLKAAPMGDFYVKYKSNRSVMNELTSRVLNQRDWLYDSKSFKNVDDLVDVVTSAVPNE